MQNFRTVISPPRAPFQISHKDKIVSIGSCFSEHIGKKFSDYKFEINVNPFGQQYNPYSISNAIHRLIDGKLYAESELVYHDELYHSFNHHGSFSSNTAEEALNGINENLIDASEDLKSATILFLTFGTSHVFSLMEKGTVVSNCHKLSGNNFDKRLMKPHEIVQVLGDALDRLRTLNPTLKIILTVSPVRYFAFGHHENTVSKSHLFTAIHELQQNHREYFYFPAYELVMDDLRDYRFFADDMLHPNYQATNYVWEKLCESMLEKKTLAMMQEIDQVLLAAKHKPRNPESEAHKKFVKKNLDKIQVLKKDCQLNFSEEERVLSSYI
jgi:hypothetical protein